MSAPTFCESADCVDAPEVVIVETPRLGMATPIALCGDCFRREVLTWGEEAVTVGARRTRSLRADNDDEQVTLGEWSR